MPVYNAGEFLDESIPSILNQTFTDFELIVIDDCSTDNSSPIIKRYADQNPRIVYIRNDKNVGNIATRNKAIERARGIYIAELDGDDIALPSRLKLQYNYLISHPDIVLIGGGAEIINNHGLTIGHKRPTENFSLIKYKMLFGNPFVHSAIFYKKNIIKELGGYNPDYNHAEDYNLYSGLIHKGYGLGNVTELIIKYRSHQQSITAIPATRKIQMTTTYRISHNNISEYIHVSENKIKMLIDTVHKLRTDLLSVLSTILFFKKLTRAFIIKENLNNIEAGKIWKVYTSDFKKLLLGNYLKTKWPKLTEIIKRIRP